VPLGTAVWVRGLLLERSKEEEWGMELNSGLFDLDVGFVIVQGFLTISLHLSLRLASLIIQHRSFINIWTPWRQPAII